MELRHLRYFTALAEELHFGRAAGRLNIAQPALSLQIRALEKELGVKLLLRSTRKVELTEAGSVFYKQALSILNAVKSGATLARIAAGKEIRDIRIGTIYPATFGILPSFLARINRRFPNISISVRSDTTDNIVKELERGNLNIGFIRPVENTGAISYRSISQEDYLLAISSKNPLSKKERVSIADLRKEKIISFERSNLTYTEHYFHDVFQKHRLLESIAYICNDTLSLISLVAAGLGVGFVPEWAKDFPNRGISLCKVEGVDLRIGMGIAWNKDDPVASKGDIVDIARHFSN